VDWKTGTGFWSAAKNELYVRKPFGTTFVVPVHPRNPTLQDQNLGISSFSLSLSELWLLELEKRYPEP
jgi:hypothetical protein